MADVHLQHHRQTEGEKMRTADIGTHLRVSGASAAARPVDSQSAMRVSTTPPLPPPPLL